MRPRATSVAEPGCLSRIRIFFIPDPDPHFFHPGSCSRIKEFKYFNPKKWFLTSRKYDPCCSSRIRILTFYTSRIPDPGVKKASDTGSESATLQASAFGVAKFLASLYILQVFRTRRTPKLCYYSEY